MGGAQCFVELQEKSGTQWVWVNDGNNDGAVEFVAKPAGLYEYRSYAECEEIVSEDEEEDEWEEWEETSASVSVQVGSTPVVDSWEVQLNYVYEARFNGAQDIFLKRTTAADPGNGTIDTLILRSSGGSFQPIVPTAAQIANASTWPIADVDIVVDDVNVDGFVDVSIKRLAGLISGAADQLIYAPGQVFNSTPKGVLNLNQNIVNFANDMLNYYVDPDYFEDNSATHEVDGYWEETIECGWSWSWGEGEEEDDEFGCWEEYEWVEGYEYTTYPGINNNAVTVWEAIRDALSGQGSYGGAKSILGQVLGVVIGGGSYCVEFGFDSNSDECHGLEIELVWSSLSASVLSGGGQCTAASTPSASTTADGLVGGMQRLITTIKNTGAIFHKIHLTLTAIHLVEIAGNTVNLTVTWALQDIARYNLIFMHVTNPQGSIIQWQIIQVPWSEYCAGSVPDKKVLINFMNDYD